MKITKTFQKIHYRFLLLLIAGFVMGQSALAQAGEITASGIVKDAKGEAIPFVSVSVAGNPAIGTQTGLDGDFSLSVPEGSTLEFKSMNFLDHKMKAAANMSVTLQDDVQVLTTLEVVGIGYGQARKSDLTGAITSINAGDMRQGVITSSEQLLQSKIAGLSVVQSSGDPTSGVTMRLRGGSSLSGNNDPLVVVDGIPGVPMNAVAPADIVSVDVLKDASASAIYGSRGANGVILVTTRKQSANKDATTTSADYSGYFSVANASKQLDLLTADNWNTHSDINYGGDTNWQDEIQQTAITHSHAVNFSSASNKAGFNGNIAYLNGEGVIKTTKTNQLSANLSGYVKVWDDRLKLDAGVIARRNNYSQIDYDRVFRSAYGLNPTLPIRWPEGSLWGIAGEYAQMTGGVDARYVNPIEYFNNRTNDKSEERVLLYAKADLRIMEGLNASVNISRNHVTNNNRLYEYIAARINSGQMYKGNATHEFGDWEEQLIEGYLTYDKEFNKQHRLNVMGGASYAVDFASGNGSGVRGFDTDEFLYNNLEAGIFREYIYSYKNKSQMASLFGRVNYSYDSRYMITATLRGDGASKFGKNNKWGIFPSVSAAWRISQEGFMEETKGWLQNLKLRVGYGVSGNQAMIKPYNSLKLWATSNTDNGQFRVTVPIVDDDGNVTGERVAIINYQNENPDLKWESTEQWNVGLDFTVFKRIDGTLEFYHKNTRDIFYFYRMPSTGVFFVPYYMLNAGNMTNTGVELTLNASILKGEDYSLDAALNLAHNVNKITKLANPLFPGTPFEGGWLFGMSGGGGMGYPTQLLKEGYSIGSFFGAVCYGKDADGNLVYRKTIDGVETTTTNASAADQLYLGNAMPKLNLGFNLSGSYKNWDATINTYGMFGQKIYNGTRQDLYSRDDRGMLNVMNDWAENNQLLNGVSDYWLEDGSFFRLQSITLGYTFDLKKIKMTSLRLYATAENLFVITGYKGVDPEVSQNIKVIELDDKKKEFPGIDWYNNYPKPRTYTVGVNLKF